MNQVINQTKKQNELIQSSFHINGRYHSLCISYTLYTHLVCENWRYHKVISLRELDLF